MGQSLKGSCLCGKLRFSCTGASLWCAHCHCSMCQRAHGAPLVTWVGVPEEALEIRGQESLRWYQSTDAAQRGFCTNCGSTLFFRSSRWPGEMHVVRANIEGNIDRGPSGHAYWESHASWFAFEDDLPRKNSGAD